RRELDDPLQAVQAPDFLDAAPGLIRSQAFNRWRRQRHSVCLHSSTTAVWVLTVLIGFTQPCNTHFGPVNQPRPDTRGVRIENALLLSWKNAPCPQIELALELPWRPTGVADINAQCFWRGFRRKRLLKAGFCREEVNIAEHRDAGLRLLPGPAQCEDIAQ